MEGVDWEESTPVALTVLGQNWDIAVALNPRVDAKNSGMASTFKPDVSGDGIQKQPPIRRNFTQMWWGTIF